MDVLYLHRIYRGPVIQLLGGAFITGPRIAGPRHESHVGRHCCKKDPASVGGRRLHPVTFIARISRNLGGGRGPKNGCRTHSRRRLEAAPFLRGNNYHYYSAGKVTGVESRLPGLPPRIVSRPCWTRVLKCTAGNFGRASGRS